MVAPHRDAQEQSDGQIIIPEKYAVGEFVVKCEVIAVGEPVTKCKVGDTVILPVCGYALFLNRAPYRVVPEDDILGVLVESAILTA